MLTFAGPCQPERLLLSNVHICTWFIYCCIYIYIYDMIWYVYHNNLITTTLEWWLGFRYPSQKAKLFILVVLVIYDDKVVWMCIYKNIYIHVQIKKYDPHIIGVKKKCWKVFPGSETDAVFSIMSRFPTFLHPFGGCIPLSKCWIIHI